MIQHILKRNEPLIDHLIPVVALAYFAWLFSGAWLNYAPEPVVGPEVRVPAPATGLLHTSDSSSLVSSSSVGTAVPLTIDYAWGIEHATTIALVVQDSTGNAPWRVDVMPNGDIHYYPTPGHAVTCEDALRVVAQVPPLNP